MTDEIGRIRFHNGDLEQRAAIYNPALSVQGVGGKVVAYVGCDTDEYAEISIDFIADDGRVMQLAFVGQDHSDPDAPKMHAGIWPGTTEDAQYFHEIEVSERSYWYTYGKEG
jgi:hypothetical protein